MTSGNDITNIEKNCSNDSMMDVGNGNGMEKLRAAPSVSIPPELFEKLYLSPQNQVKGELQSTFGNPTPM